MNSKQLLILVLIEFIVGASSQQQICQLGGRYLSSFDDVTQPISPSIIAEGRVKYILLAGKTIYVSAKNIASTDITLKVTLPDNDITIENGRDIYTNGQRVQQLPYTIGNSVASIKEIQSSEGDGIQIQTKEFGIDSYGENIIIRKLEDKGPHYGLCEEFDISKR